MELIAGQLKKFEIIWEYEDDEVTLDDVQFSTTWWASQQLIIPKAACFHDTETGKWYAYLPTLLVGYGELFMTLKAEVPDENAPGGVVTDISMCDTGCIVIHGRL